MTRRSFLALLLLSAATSQAVVSLAAPVNFDGLIRNSPFGGNLTAAPGARSDTPLEFRGVLVDGGVTYFSIYEVASKSSLWVGLNETGNPYKVQGYDGEKGSATIEYQGRTLTLPLKQAKVATLTANPLGPGGNAGPPGAGGPQLVGPAASPAEEAARLSAVTEEIRRRRALRQQQTGQGGPQPMPAGPDAQGPRPMLASPTQTGPQPAVPLPNRN